MNLTLSRMATFQQVLSDFGGVVGLAHKLQITPQAVSQWKGKIPHLRAYQIAELSGGRWKVSDLPVAKGR